MLTILKYLKVRYIDAHLGEKAQGMMEYAIVIAFVVGLAAYLIYGNHEEKAMKQIIEDAGNTLDASSRNSSEK